MFGFQGERIILLSPSLEGARSYVIFVRLSFVVNTLERKKKSLAVFKLFYIFCPFFTFHLSTPPVDLYVTSYYMSFHNERQGWRKVPLLTEVRS